MKHSGLVLAASILALSAASSANAEMWNRNLTYVNSWSNWTNPAWLNLNSTDIWLTGHGQWQCHTGNGNDNNHTEYDSQLRIIYDTRAELEPNWQLSCSGHQTHNFREFRLQLSVWRADGSTWTPLYSQQVVWQGQWGTHDRKLEYNYPNPISGRHYLTRADTYVQGKPWLYGQIQFQYFAT